MRYQNHIDNQQSASPEQTEKMNYTWILYSVWILYLINACTAFEAQENNSTLKPTHVKLIEHLKHGYNKEVRPVQDWRTATNVYVDIMIYAILGVDEKNQAFKIYIWCDQYWVDEFLTWDPKKFENIKRISIPTHGIWEPDVTVKELVDPGKAAEDTYVYVHYNGTIYYSKPLQLKATCKFDIYYFPFDQHNCSLTFISLINTIQDVNISIWKPEKVSHNYTSAFTDFGEWDIISVSPSFNTVDYESDVSGETTFSLILRRKPLFYFINLIVPSMLLMIMNIAGFYLPPESGERTSFKITLLLGYSVFLVIVSDKSPPTGTPLIGSYFTICMILIVISVMETIFIIRIIHQENCNRAVPKWVKTLVLEKMATLICLKEENHFNTSHDVVSDISEQRVSSSTEMLANYSDENMKHYDKESPTTKDSDVILRILKQIVSMQEGLKNITEQSVSSEWIHIAHIVDTFIFRIYIIVILVYMVAFSAVWFQWLHV